MAETIAGTQGAAAPTKREGYAGFTAPQDGDVRWFEHARVRLGLRWAMLLAMVPMLLLPVASLQFLSEMAGLTRDERRAQLEATARGFAAALHERRDLFGPDPRAPLPGNAEPLPVATLPAVSVDGVADEWREVVPTPVPSQPQAGAPADTLQVRMAMARVPGVMPRLYLLVEVFDERYLEPEPPLVLGSEIEAAFDKEPRTGDGQERAGDLLLVNAGAAHDALRPLDAGITVDADGWRAEMLVPADTRFIRVRVRDVDYQASRRLEATADTGLLALGMLADGSDAAAVLRADAREAQLHAALRGFARVGGRVTVTDADGKTLARLGDVDPTADPAAGGLGRALVSWAVGLSQWSTRPSVGVAPLAQALRGLPVTISERGERGDGHPDWLTTSAQPIWFEDRVAGALVLEQSDDSDLARAQSAFEWLAMFTVIAILATTLTLLGFATLTVTRVRALKRAAEQAIDLRGRVVGAIPQLRLRDEIASLADGYSRVLGRLREHQQYLANLRSRLVHELRTPIMVVRGSLDNLAEVDSDDPGRDAYLNRALGGTQRLERIVASMSEAANLESMLSDSPLERIDLAALLRELVGAYNQAWGRPANEQRPVPRFQFECALAAAPVAVVPEAIAQAVDKLASNARDFAAPGSVVRLQLSAAAGVGHGVGYRIAMHNTGAPLPDLMADSLFDSMVSVRGEGRAGDSHLGLGLYLVRLIAEFHGGEPFARNEVGGVAVGFTIASGQMPIDDRA
ncbi:MAG: histidine kinase dimerization/phospho-acceptor domain-containing protein [Burkholderiaceae bacterium]